MPINEADFYNLSYINSLPPWITPYIHWGRLPEDRLGPSPEPWRFIGDVISILGVKAGARSLRDEGIRQRLDRSLDAKLRTLVDGYCGTPWPHPWPGPQPRVYTAAAQLALLAHSVQAGEMRDDLLGVSADLLERSIKL